MSENSKRSLDGGYGCSGKSLLTIRMVRPDDEYRMLNWRNDPFIVSRTTTQRPVNPDEHKRWFHARLKDPRCRLQIIEVSGQPVGSLRFDRAEDDTCIISVYLVKQFTAQGYGTRAICKASYEVMREWNVRIIACVRTDNDVGAKTFLRANFREISPGPYCPPNHRTFLLSQLTAASDE